MKRKIELIPFYTIASVLILVSSCTNNEKSKKNNSSQSETIDQFTHKIKSIDCPNCCEDEIDLTYFPMSIKESTNRVSLCNQLLKIDQNAVNTFSDIVIPKNTLEDLKAKSCSYAASLCQEPGSECFKIKALKVWFSIENNSIRFIYEPVVLTSQDQNEEKNYTVKSENKIFKYDPTNNLQEVSDRSSIESYSVHIKFKKDIVTTDFRDFNAQYNKDSESVIFTFQELFAVMNDNNSNGLIFWSIAYFDNSVLPLSVRHSLVATHQELSLDKLTSNFLNRVGNHANPCPPQCEIKLRSLPTK